MDGGKNEGLEKYGGAFSTEGVAGHVDHQTAENQFLKNGGKQGEYADADPEFGIRFHIEHRFKDGLTFGIEFGENGTQISPRKVFAECCE